MSGMDVVIGRSTNESANKTEHRIKARINPILSASMPAPKFVTMMPADMTDMNIPAMTASKPMLTKKAARCWVTVTVIASTMNPRATTQS